MPRIRPSIVQAIDRRIGAICRHLPRETAPKHLDTYVLRWGPLHLHRGGEGRKASRHLGDLSFLAAHVSAHATHLAPVVIWRNLPGEPTRLRSLRSVRMPRAVAARLRWIEEASHVTGFLREAGLLAAYVAFVRLVRSAVPRGRAYATLRAEQDYESALAALHEGDAEGARAGFEKLLRCERDPAWRAAILNNLGGALVMLERDAAANRVFRRALKAVERDPEGSPRVRAVARRGLATTIAQLGRPQEAIRLLESMLNEGAVQSEEGVISGLLTRASLASIQADEALDCGDLLQIEAAVDGMRGAIDRLSAVLGAAHPTSLVAAWNLATFERDRGNVTAAKRAFEKLLRDRERVLGPGHPDTLCSRRELAELLEAQGGRKRALRLLNRNVAERNAATEEVLASELALGRLLLDDKHEEGEALLAQVGRRARRSGLLAIASKAWSTLARSQASRSEFHAAERSFAAALRVMSRSDDAVLDAERGDAYEGLARVYLVTNRPHAAIPKLRLAASFQVGDPPRQIELQRLVAVALRDAGKLRAAIAAFCGLASSVRHRRGPEASSLHVVLAGLARTLELDGEIVASAETWWEVAQLRAAAAGPRSKGAREALAHARRLAGIAST